jgi:hypothetical protein
VSAPVCSEALFERWNGTGAVVVTDPTAANTTVTVTGNGTLNAIYGPAAWVTIGLSPSAAAGDISWNGTRPTNGSTFETLDGSYSVRAEAASGWGFVRWATTGGVTVVENTTSVASNGTIQAVFEPMSTSPSPSNSSGPTAFLGLSLYEWGLVVVLLVVVGAIAGVWVYRREKHEPPTEPAE